MVDEPEIFGKPRVQTTNTGIATFDDILVTVSSRPLTLPPLSYASDKKVFIRTYYNGNKPSKIDILCIHLTSELCTSYPIVHLRLRMV